MIRAGERGKVADAFSRGFAAIGWDKTGSLGHAKSRDAIRELYLEAYPAAKNGQVPGDVAMLFKFRVVMRIGDRVVTYDARHKEYLVGSITSGYIYDPKKILGYPHLRRVKWQGRVRRDKLPVTSRNSLGSTLTIFMLDEAVWASIASVIGNEGLPSNAEVTEERGGDLYYRMFSPEVRDEAFRMRAHYELFYCLEKSIRDLVSEKLNSKYGTAWWDDAVPEAVKENVNRNIQREEDAGVTRRSINRLDYTNFGELGDIVRNNWEVFDSTFNNAKAFSKVMSNLNMLRAPIAHCCPLADDEVVRLKLTLKDWFRLME